jgi:hypothetical protein
LELRNALAWKAPNLLALNPDIAVVQEYSKKSVDVLHGHGLSGFCSVPIQTRGWQFFAGGFALQAVGKLFGKWVVPVRVRGAVVDFNLLAVWASPIGTKRAENYIGEVHGCLVKHHGWFSHAPVIAAGDFNSNVQWDAKRPGRNQTEVLRLFEGHGLISAYHARHEEKQGAETRSTYYFYRHQDKPFQSTTCSSRKIGS